MHNYNQMLTVVNKNIKSIAGIFGLVMLIVSLNAPLAHAEYKSSSIANAIEAKCDLVKKNYKGDKKSADYKDLIAACNGSGDYKANATQKPERAARLIIICGYDQILKASNAYAHPDNIILNGECDQIINNDELRALSDDSEYASPQDPALSCANNSDEEDNSKDCDLIKKYVNPFIVFLTAVVGIAVTIGIISGGIRYASAGDDPQKVSAGKNQIRNALLALLTYIFLYAAIKWLTPV
jgi:hypothetical protein